MSNPAPAPAPVAEAEHQPAEAIAVDPAFIASTREDNDSSSAYSEAAPTSTASLSSSILHFRELHGRTYQNFTDSEYWQPNDERHNDSLDLNHHMFLLLNNNKLFHAPLENPQSVLDVGTGTGIWAVDFADQFPSARVIGTDLSPIQPEWAPPNCKFELDDAELEWTFRDNEFDFVFIRYMVGSIGDWPRLYKQAYRCLKPGGWIEHSEFRAETACDDGSVPENTIYDWWTKKLLIAASERIGKTFTPTKDNKHVAALREAGFTGALHTKDYKVPLGSWPVERKWKEIGEFNQASLEQGLEGFGLLLGTQVMGFSLEEMQVAFAKMRQAFRNPKWHVYYPWYVLSTPDALATLD
ncbi:S-adenosyl-L-methionine-dependent methyltransferase [Cercophora newfieldiana]|uniref:S-adenosyl-L-methionine-dependent methyltransferase n=1 Tax=Cercophora newfieldiana TaxID=92897 RepID=A0AA39Y940_9PEZI|nr:S-adenosyl-L-methionine-dependent methyltransferase [Cercophora newfieldiana]